MANITVVGSGASGVHFALTALKKGHRVEMLDVGYTGPRNVNPDFSFIDIKNKLKDPVAYFLGKNFESVIPPGLDQDIYEFPPNKQYIFKVPPAFKSENTDFDPLFSFAQGGLAEAWTGGSYPFDDRDLNLFPFDFQALKPYYEEIAGRIGLIGDKDDLTRFFPWHKNLISPLELDENSRILLKKYQRRRETLNRKMGFYLGRSRIATLSKDMGKRKACDYSGRCLWGCPSDSLYVPSLTLDECRKYSHFTYRPGIHVEYFTVNSRKRITRLVFRDLKSRKRGEMKVDNLVLAAGTLSSSKIFLDSIYRQTGQIVQLEGLMDNRQILVPFVNLNMLGKSYNPDSYVYHQLAVGFECKKTAQYIHGQITTLKTALIHPVTQKMPLDFKTSTYLTRNLHAALGVINLNFCDSRRRDNRITIEPAASGSDSPTILKISYKSISDEESIVSDAIKRTMKFLRKLGVIAPPMMVQHRPMGASVHYSGTLPMSTSDQPLSTTPDCRSRDFDNLFLVDGSTFPFLPAKNLTFSMMANAARVADNVFK
jgi:choline dehydrogenase-like flavoprotein